MGENSKIEWTHHTFNPWIGCAKVSEACKFCYAETQNNHRGWAVWGLDGTRKRTSEANWRKPIQWDKAAKALGERHRVFCASLADVFEDHEQIRPEWYMDLWNLIKATPNLDWLLLTKRPENIEKLLPADWGDGYKNVWLGISVENQKMANLRIPILAEVSAKVRFVSAEPLLGSWTFPPSKGMLNTGYAINWVIIGGESGNSSKTRMLSIGDVKELIDQCDYYKIPILFKQLGVNQSTLWGMKDLKGGNFDEYPQELDWLKRREYPINKQ